MATREQLEQEAYELYPESHDAETGHHVDDWGFSECQREAHVRAKTITAEQVEKAAMTMHNLVVDTMWGECASEKEADMSVMRAAFRAAGFHIEGGEEQ